jgi:lipopolysaccharide/colanic/teichoic acid biosynthesis glycosyltransferase
MKRSTDVVIAGLALVVTSPVFAVIAIAIKIDSRGPVLFRQTRVGRHGHPFVILKFRSMTTSTDGPVVTVAGDSRVTRVGRFLRVSKLDELPQLWNVVRGDMSLVGPRPEMEQYVALWTPAQKDSILSVRPGITDPASVEFRHESQMLAGYSDPEQAYRDIILPKKAEAYVQYVSTRSWLGDLRLIIATLRAIFSSGGATGQES